MGTEPLPSRDTGARRRRLATALAALLATAATPTPALYAQLHWRSAGPFRGGRVLAVAASPANPRRFYFGAVNGGVWRTDDAGRTWQPIADALPAGSIGALAIAPSAPATLYVGTGEADMRSDIAQGVGIFRTTDDGAHWTALGLADTQQIAKILVDPKDPDTVLVAALGHPYGPNDQRGVFRTEDGGQHWTRTLFHDANTGAIDLATAPGDPQTVYAALWQTRRTPWSVYPPSSGPGSGLYKSTDGGRTWVPLTGHGLPAAPARIGLATTPAAPNRVLALISVRDGQGAGLYRSDDRGGTWRRVSADPRLTERAWYFSGLTADPRDPDRITVCNTILLRSTDGGAHFAPILGDPTGDDFHTLAIDPTNPDRQILGVDQGALVTLNGGASWSSWFNQPTGQFYHVSTDNAFPYRIYGAQQDSGAAAIPSRSGSAFDGISMMQFHEVAAGGESDEIAPDPDDPDLVYGGRVDRLDLRSGQLQSLDPTLAHPGDWRGAWTLPLAWGADHALYFANQRIFRTRDAGQTWTPISPDLTRENPPVPPTLDAPAAQDVAGQGTRRGVVYALAPSPRLPDMIWAGTDDGKVWLTKDAGTHWQDTTPAGLTPWSKIGVIEASHSDPETTYLAVDRHRLDDQNPYLYRTTDGGAHWTLITTGLPTGDGPRSVNVIREDPAEPRLLYAGTERGFYVSFDRGDHWQKLQSGLPVTSVRDITIHGDDIVIATHGRGFYVLDDSRALRALAADPTLATRLFPIAQAIRIHPPAFAGTPLPAEEPAAPNPPAGAILDYFLAAPAQHATLDITRDGETIRHFASTDPGPDLNPEKLKFAPAWVPIPSHLATTQGAHRFVWNLQLPDPGLTPIGDNDPGAIWAPPGHYEATLTIDGQRYTEPFDIRPDPRLHLAPGALDAEFTAARAVEAARLRCAASPTPLPAIARRLEHLAAALNGADAAPSPDLRAGIRETLADLDAALAKSETKPKTK